MYDYTLLDQLKVKCRRFTTAYLRAVFLNIRFAFVKRPIVLNVDESDSLRAFFGEAAGDGVPKPSRAAGDEGDAGSNGPVAEVRHCM